ncbi:MAG: hypothetical protein ABIQ51_01800 [Mesorhizobium sp.]
MNAVDLNEFSCLHGRQASGLGKPNKKPDCTFMQSGIRQEWRGKTGHVPALKHTVGSRQKFHRETGMWRKKSAGHGWHANAALHNRHDSPILRAVEDQPGA